MYLGLYNVLKWIIVKMLKLFKHPYRGVSSDSFNYDEWSVNVMCVSFVQYVVEMFYFYLIIPFIIAKLCINLCPLLYYGVCMYTAVILWSYTLATPSIM